MEFFLWAVLSVLSAVGMAILLNEKGDKFPVSIATKPLRFIIRYTAGLIFRSAPEVMDCTTCLSFWTTLITDLIIRYWFYGTYFFWPLSGFIACLTAWFIYELLASIDKLTPREKEQGLE
jgi:hypothetical protein